MAPVNLKSLTEKLKTPKGLDMSEQLALLQILANQFKGTKISGMHTLHKVLPMSVSLGGIGWETSDMKIPAESELSVDSADQNFSRRACDREHFAMLRLASIQGVRFNTDNIKLIRGETKRNWNADGDITIELCMDNQGNLFAVMGHFNTTVTRYGDHAKALMTPVIIRIVACSTTLLSLLEGSDRKEHILGEAMESISIAFYKTQEDLMNSLKTVSANWVTIAGIQALA